MNFANASPKFLRKWGWGIGILVMLGVAACVSLSREQLHPDLLENVSVVELRIENANAFLVFMEDAPEHALLIDLGIPGNAEKLAQRVREAGVDPADLDAAIITHGHYDHAGGARYFQDTFGTVLIAGNGDRVPIETGEELSVCPTSLMARAIRSQSKRPGTWTSKPDYYVEDRFDLSEVSQIKGEIILVPGHTAGSVIVNIGDASFVGDQVRGRIFGRGAARHFFMCDLADNNFDLQSILADISPDAEIFYPGHMGAITRAELQSFVDRELRNTDK